MTPDPNGNAVEIAGVKVAFDPLKKAIGDEALKFIHGFGEGLNPETQMALTAAYFSGMLHACRLIAPKEGKGVKASHVATKVAEIGKHMGMQEERT
jgi:hypothetical protein